MFRNNKKKILAAVSLIVAGLGGGIGIGYALNSCYSSSSVTPPTPVDLTIITNDIDQKYIISSDTQIYYRSGTAYSSHNRFLNLALYAQENNISSTNYAISGTVDFGILIGFNQSISLYGIDDGKIEVIDSTSIQHSCGILIGSVNSSDVPTDNGYSGNLIIDHSLDISITNTSTAANAISVGVEFYTISLGTNQLINGNFNIISDKEARGVYVNGDEFGEITVNGNFIITANADACGVRFGGIIRPYSKQIINGTFQIAALAINGNGYGVLFSWQSKATGENSSQIINGVFSISSANASVFGVYFNSVCNSTVVVNGLFNITGNNGGTGVGFQTNIDGSIYIGGIFIIHANQNAAGVKFGGNVSGVINIPGYFSISNVNSAEVLYGVWFSGASGGILAAISITGLYCLYSNASNAVNGIKFPDGTASALITGTPNFSSNKAEWASGPTKSWKTIGGVEEWNGSDQTAQADANLNIKSITSTSGSFSVNVITYTANPPSSIPTFNFSFKNKLYDYYENLPTSSQLKVDISNILDSSEWDNWGQ